MMIGKLLLNPVRPDDLDKQVNELTGCSAAELRGLLGGAHLGILAAALHPFINTSCELSVPEIASLMAQDKANLRFIRREIVALYEGQDDVGPKPAGNSRRRK